MTGFGRATAELPNKKITVEVKSLNSKQFDLNTRIPSAYRSSELALRRILADRLERGKVDLTISVEHTGCATSTVIDVEALRACKQRITEASRAAGIPEPADWWSLLTRFPDVLTSENDSEADEPEKEALCHTVAEAAEALMAYRRTEGVKLEEFFAARIAAISDLLAIVPRFESERIDRIRQRLVDGIAKIPAIDFDKGRLEQEMIFYIEKLDVNEEKQRLAQHLAYFIETMNSSHPGQGKKLGFIAQEMGREINTLGSKSNHAEMQKTVVLMKDQLEQIKEQVLNVM